jgi:hypothetical protein
MISRRLWGSAIVIFMFGVALNITEAQELVGTVAQPVSGFYARHANAAPDTQIGIFDITSKKWRSLLPSRNARMFWRKDGTQLVFRQSGSAFTILNYPELTVSSTVLNLNGISAELPADELSYRPLGWSNDGSNLLVQVSYLLAGQPHHYVVYLTDLTGTVLQHIRQWKGDELVANLPLPPNIDAVQITGYTTIERNPVFDDWVLMQFIGIEAHVNVLWNFSTQEVISLDILVPDVKLSAIHSDWSHDGKKLLLNAASLDLLDSYIVTFQFTPETGAALVESAIVENRTAEHWLDAGNVFFSLVSNYDGGASYVLGEIVDGEYRETPFFTLNGEMFRYESFGDWFMQADETERNRLSCLFDLALPTQLAVNDEAQVIADDGIGLRLRAAPDRFSAELQTMAEGTPMTIINGPACSGGYRWWQVELSDGTVGWAAEADASEYFLDVSE